MDEYWYKAHVDMRYEVYSEQARLDQCNESIIYSSSHLYASQLSEE